MSKVPKMKLEEGVCIRYNEIMQGEIPAQGNCAPVITRLPVRFII